jgi:hypothetical protein
MRFAAATETCDCYNSGIDFVANPPCMLVRDAQAADLPQLPRSPDVRLRGASDIPTEPLCSANNHGFTVSIRRETAP